MSRDEGQQGRPSPERTTVACALGSTPRSPAAGTPSTPSRAPAARSFEWERVYNEVRVSTAFPRAGRPPRSLPPSSRLRDPECARTLTIPDSLGVPVLDKAE